MDTSGATQDKLSYSVPDQDVQDHQDTQEGRRSDFVLAHSEASSHFGVDAKFAHGGGKSVIMVPFDVIGAERSRR